MIFRLVYYISMTAIMALPVAAATDRLATRFRRNRPARPGLAKSMRPF